jgi:hypothetical protein
MALPAPHKARSREEWLTLAKDADPAKRSLVTRCLRDIGIEPNDYIAWKIEDRVDAILKAQGEGQQEAEVEEEAVPSVKTPARKSAKTAPAADGGSTAELKIMLDKLGAQVDDLQEVASQQTKLLADCHFLVRVLVQSNKQLKQNSEDEELQEAFYGRLVVEEGKG